MSRNPRVSVVIPTYRREAYLLETLQSVSEQTFSDLEVIVVSDGASEESAAAVRDHGDKRVRFLEVAHQGRPAPARNKGLWSARGEYVAFCDDDDLWDRRKVELQVSLLDARPDVVLAHTRAVNVDEQSRVLGKRKMSPGRYDARPVKGFLSLPFFHVLLSSVMVRGEAARLAGGFDEHPLLSGREDTEFIIRLAARTGASFARLCEDLVRYRHVEGSLSRSDGWRSAERRDYFHRVLLEKGCFSPAQNRVFVSNQYAARALASLRSVDDAPGALSYAAESWRLRPGLINSMLVLASLPVAAIQAVRGVRT